ncbi:GNAT family N-acetyltransferase [Winogradskya consettensis]|uniref:GNAT family N-acetyltransferase n=1 Tax=Winogradskya consettensis TaxID=113560 RepID=A0A919VY94_9ACTN|nr:GNAT family N-acetyltransferase [Actinoplanes consettensis]GIM79255.1 GNAT family N-acetyltransferase [Actinoplanes consettensis]
MDIEITPAAPDDVEALTALVNTVYADGEKGLWRDGAERTTAAEMRGLVDAGEIAVARRAGRVVGQVRIVRLEPGLGEFGMLAAEPSEQGSGIGRQLVQFAEDWARAQGFPTMQCELLVPRDWEHPVKEFLRAWYTRIGYRQVSTGSIDEMFPHLAPLLATECSFLVFHKDLG